MKKRMTALFAAAAMLICPLTACGSQQQSSQDEENVAMADMPYGSTLSMNVNTSVPMQYDNRFIDSELVDKIAAYYHSVQENDAEEFASVLFPLYHKYEMEQLYEGQYTEEQIVQSTYDALHDYYGGDFEFSLIDITQVVEKDQISANRDALIGMLDDLASDQGEEKVSEQTDSFIEMTITRYLTDKGSGEHGETDSKIADETLYGIHYQGQWYLIYA